MYDREIAIIREYMDKNLPELDNIYPKYEFDTRSYARWTANEILERLIIEDSKLPCHITGKEPRSVVEIINEFIAEVDYYFYISTDTRRQEMFNIAVNTANYIKHLFL